QVEIFDAEVRERAVDAADDIGPRVRRQPIEVGHVLCVHLYITCRGGAAVSATAFQPLADERFDAGVDVRAVERRDSGVHEPTHVGQRISRVDTTVTAGQLPAAFQEARDRVAGRELDAGQHWSQRGGSGTAVTSPWRNV